MVSFCAMLDFLEPGAITKKGHRGNFDVVFLAGEDGSIATMFNLLTFCVSCGVTAIAMAVSEVCARVMSHNASSTVHQVSCAVLPFFTNHIPFLTLNLSIIIGIIVNMAVIVVFNVTGANGVQISAILTVILVTNKEARKHVMLRLKQKFDSSTIGWTNTTPVVLFISSPEL